MTPAGKVVNRRGCTKSSDYIGASGSTLWLTPPRSGATRAWTWGSSAAPSSIGVTGKFADPDHDVLFVGPSGWNKAAGPTSLSDPGAPRWSVTGFEPFGLSSGGARVMGRDYATGDIEIRRMSDGALVRRLAFGPDYDSDPAWWESSSTILVPVYGTQRGNEKTWLLRCSTAGTCHVVSHPGDSYYTHRATNGYYA